MRMAALIAGAAIAVSGCTREGDTATPGGEPTTTPLVVAPVDDAASRVETTSPPVPTVTLPPDPVDPSVEPTSTLAPVTLPPLTTVTVVTVPESGVPGIDSDDAFCAAWSRFGGSWQVIQVAANFAPDPSVVPTMEVAAAPSIRDAYDDMFANWPDELADEEAVVADGFFGPLARRAEVAMEALAAAGATPADLDAIADGWVDALAVRDLDDPVLLPVLDDRSWSIVDAAATAFDEQLAGFVDDPSMVISVETPSTDVFLATACPDQGALTGGEIDATG